MKAITIIQPWATLIALGEKNFETRSWATKHRGPIAIHAGKKVDREACEMEPIKSTLAEYGYTADELPTGAVVAIAELTECWSVSRCLRGDIILERDGGNEMREEAFGYYDDGRYAWEIEAKKWLEVPIPAKGQQGLWNWQPEGQGGTGE
ncbi:ASCH domain-containing protein [Paenibacillus thiaminolyticus]|uniref:ASCH domain-containing protein n=1 Tax=Paenibacillus thiaminolyticus TaxID=49283 RepID=UPI0035A5D0AA